MARRAIWPLLLAGAISGSGCVPASWGAGALLYPSRRPVTMARPAGARDVEFRSDGLTLRGWKFAAKTPRRGTVRVTGLATSGRAYAYSPYGYGAYGATAYNYRPDLRFRCDVDYRGYVRDVDINRR